MMASLTDSGCFQPDVSSREGGPGELGNWRTGDLGIWVCPGLCRESSRLIYCTYAMFTIKGSVSHAHATFPVELVPVALPVLVPFTLPVPVLVALPVIVPVTLPVPVPVES